MAIGQEVHKRFDHYTPLGGGERLVSAQQNLWESVSLQPDHTYGEQWTQSNPKVGGKYISGGPWTLNKESVVSSVAQAKSPTYRGTVSLGGPRFTVARPLSYANPTDLELDSAGTKAIAQSDPTNPAFDLSTYLGEILHEGLPYLPGAQTKDATGLAKSAGSEYLNVEFGWSPFVRGLKQFANAVVRSSSIVDGYLAEANRLVKRRVVLLDDRRTGTSTGSYTVSPSFFGQFYQGSCTVTAFKQMWFEGAFMYHLPLGTGVADRISRYGSYARKLLGIGLSPEVIWNLAPWSWAIDWFVDIGSVMQNASMSGNDGAVMYYGYTMCHTGFTEEHVAGPHPSMGSLGPVAGSLTRLVTSEQKRRRSGSPFGFGVNQSSLSARQIAIMAALGLSKT